MRGLFISILELTIPVSALIALLLLLSPLIKRSYVSKWRYYMWMFVAVRLLIPLRIDLGRSVTMTVPETIGAANTAAASGGGIDIVAPAAVLWLAGAAVFAAYQVFEYVRFKGLSGRWSRDVKDEMLLSAFDKAKKDIGAGNGIRVKVCKAVSTPMIFGMIKPVLLLPPVEFNADDLPVILRHELVHYKRRDIWYKLLLTAVRTVYWFDPLVHMMARAANRDIELACDAEVVKDRDADYRRHYCEAILRLVHNGNSHKTALSTCFIISKKNIMERFKNILDMRLKSNGIVMFLAVGVSAVLSGGAVTIAAEKTGIEENIQVIEQEAASVIGGAETPAAAEPVRTEAPVSSEPAEPETEAETRTPAEPVRTQAPTAVQEYNEAPRGGTEQSAADESDIPVQPQEEPVQEQPQGSVQEQAQETEPESGGVDDVSIGSGRQEVYESLGEPDEVSGGGSRETYELDDGSTAILHYDGDVLGDGYIVE